MSSNVIDTINEPQPLVPSSDEYLMQETASGSQEAFDEIFQRYYKPIFNFVRKNLYFDTIDSEDITQEIFLRVYKSSKNFDPTKKLSSWIYQIAVNEVRRFYKQSLRKKAYSINEPLNEGEDSILKGDSLKSKVINPEVESIGSMRSKLLAEAINKLPEKQRIVVFLKVYQELTFEEISQVLDCPISTVLSRMRYAIRKLKTDLEEGNFIEIFNESDEH